MKRVLTAVLCSAFVASPLVGADKPAKPLPPPAKLLPPPAKPMKDPEIEKQKDEDENVQRMLNRSLGKYETERDRFIKEAARLAPADPGNEANKNEADLFFDRLAGGPEVWSFEVARKRGGRDLFERVSAHLGLTGNSISRTQFRDYAANFLREGTSPPWRSDMEDEDRAFRELDRNRDGVIDDNEASTTLRAMATSFDANSDGLVDRAEFGSYFGARVQAAIRKHEAVASKEAKIEVKQAKVAAVSTTAAGNAKNAKTAEMPEAQRFGHLPKGLPEWFLALDDDRDGQVGLYEWRHGGREPGDFATLDSNGDGLLTADEWLRFVRDNPDEVDQFLPAPVVPSRNNRALTTMKKR